MVAEFVGDVRVIDVPICRVAQIVPASSMPKNDAFADGISRRPEESSSLSTVPLGL